MFPMSTMARTRIGLKLNHTQMVLNEEMLETRLGEASECYLDGAAECRCSCLGQRDASSSSSGCFTSQPGPDLGSAPLGCQASC